MRKLIILLAIATSVVLFSSSNAQTNNDNGTKMRPHRNRITQQLNLSKQQQDEIAQMRLDFQKKLIDLRSEIAKLKLEMKEQMLNEKMNENELLSLNEKLGKLKTELEANRIKHWMEVYKKLDDKQKEIWRQNAPMLQKDGHKMRDTIRKMKVRHFMRDNDSNL